MPSNVQGFFLFFFSIKLLFSPLSCAPSLDLGKTELTLYLPVGALLEKNSLFDKYHSSRDLEDDTLNR